MDYYKKYNIDVTPDDIIITSGGSEAVLFSFLACLNPGDEIIVPEPAYANYMAFAISAGAVIRTIATTIEEGFSLPKVEKFEELINERTRAILICNHSHFKNVVIAVMGCIVNGPGEMADADYGYVGEGYGKVTLYRKKEPVLRHIPEDEAVDKLVELITADQVI